MSADTSSSFSLIKIIPLEINIVITGKRIEATPINAVGKATSLASIAHMRIAAKIDKPPTKNPILCSIDDTSINTKPIAPIIAAKRYKIAFAKSFKGISIITFIVIHPFVPRWGIFYCNYSITLLTVFVNDFCLQIFFQ